MFKRWNRNRLGSVAKRTACQDHFHHSREEAACCRMLSLKKLAGELQEIRRQVTFNLNVNGKKITSHRVDFFVQHKTGLWEAVEYKGFATEIWNLKRKLFEAVYPEIPYRVM